MEWTLRCVSTNNIITTEYFSTMYKGIGSMELKSPDQYKSRELIHPNGRVKYFETRVKNLDDKFEWRVVK